MQFSKYNLRSGSETNRNVEFWFVNSFSLANALER